MMWSLRRSPHVRGSLAARRAVLLGMVGTVLAGCGDQPASATSVVAEASRPPAAEAVPSMPAGWQTFEDENGSLRVTLPPDLVRIEGFPGVSAQLATEPPTFAIEVHASAASDIQPPKPWTESTVQAWLLERVGGWVGVDQVTQVETSVVDLPVGEAIQIRAQLRPAGSDVMEIASYAIPTASGLVDLHILALSEYWETRRDDLELIPRLLQVGE